MRIRDAACTIWALVAATAVGAVEIRELPPVNHSLLPSGDSMLAAEVAAKTTALKPSGGDMPSPILVDRAVDVGADGVLRFGCDSRTRNFQTIGEARR